jgi:MYND finger
VVLWLAKSNRNSNERAIELLLPATRRGHATSQYICGAILSEQNSSNEDALIWFTLAAAQGQAGGQRQLGRILLDAALNNEDAELEETFRSAYWYRKAALQRDPISQATLADLVLVHKKGLFDDVPNHVGYSCLPEVLVWRRQVAAANPVAMETLSPLSLPDKEAYTEEAFKLSCACCGIKARSKCQGATRAANNTTIGKTKSNIKLCNQCRSVGYCSKTCQQKHWNRGHKVDCLQAEALKEEYEQNYFPRLAGNRDVD